MSESGGTTNVYEALPQAHPEAIVVYCGDPRFQTAFQAFTETELGLHKGQFIPLVVGGGAGVLANPERLPKEFKFMRDRFELIHRYFPSVQRVVLINHEDCLHYRMLAEKIPGFLAGHVSALRDRPGEDMSRIAEVFNRFLSHLDLQAELYYARFAGADHDKVTFDPIVI
jgi:hypothetical protein